jgi:hypothetical protein
MMLQRQQIFTQDRRLLDAVRDNPRDVREGQAGRRDHSGRSQGATDWGRVAVSSARRRIFPASHTTWCSEVATLLRNTTITDRNTAGIAGLFQCDRAVARDVPAVTWDIKWR